MKRTLYLLTLAAAMLTPAFAEEQPTIIKRAAAQVPVLRSRMNDPESFVLGRVFITRPDKHGDVTVCYEFRSHNAMGGYGRGLRALLSAKDNLRIFEPDPENDFYFGYDKLPFKGGPCSAQYTDRDITAEVKAALAETK